MAKPPSSEQVQVNFRMPADLKARIEVAAKENGRSTTAEIVSTLAEIYPPPEHDEFRGLVRSAFVVLALAPKFQRETLVEHLQAAFDTHMKETPSSPNSYPVSVVLKIIEDAEEARGHKLTIEDVDEMWESALGV